MAASLMLALVGCSSHKTVDGHAVSMMYDPNRVAGLEATGGPNGERPNTPPVSGTVANTDNGQTDKDTLLAIRDIEDYWSQNYSTFFKGTFTPVPTLVSYDSTNPNSPTVCKARTYKVANAAYMANCNLIEWDRGVELPTASKYFGPMAVPAILAHEYGHYIQNYSGLLPFTTTNPKSMAIEQQADCFGGAWLRWVAEGHSSRYTLNTTDGLDLILAGLIRIRDQIRVEGQDVGMDPHGSALDRIGAMQEGFDIGPSACARIDDAEVEKRRNGLPQTFQSDDVGNGQTGLDAPINNDTLSELMDTLGGIFKPANAPKLTTDPATCSDAKVISPAAYCPSTNTIIIDLPALQKIGSPDVNDPANQVVLQGDNTALSIVTSRYALALQHEKGVALDTGMAAMRAACLTGVAQRQMADPSGKLVLSAGDVDKAIAGLLTYGLAASDVNGNKVPAGFTRIIAYRAGLLSDADLCYQRFADAG
ncbi:MAG: neutral zinc metallopeptidase [Mycobacteriaceae bacterium]|nr:neutral zinc metallopeptidase [Mycobacteriaceae bacterium]